MIRRSLLWCLVSIATIALPTPGSAQESPRSLVLGSVELRLGMPQATVRARLGTRYRLLEVEGSLTSWIVEDTTTTPSAILGSIGFRNGALTWASRRWQQSDDTAATDLVTELYHAVASFKGDGPKTVMLSSTEEISQPGLRIYKVELQLGPRLLTLLLTQGLRERGGGQVSLDETIRVP